jgi:integrase
MPVIKKRLHLRPRAGGISIDRFVNFVVGEIDAVERAGLRGVVFEAKDRWDVNRRMGELRELACTARDDGKEAEFLDALDQRDAPGTAGPSPTFAEFAKEWADVTFSADGLTASEIESTRSILELHLVPFFGRYRMGSIDARLIDKYKAEKRRQEHQYGTGYAASTINNHLSVLRRVLCRAVEYVLIDRLPMTPRLWMRNERTEDDDSWLEPEDEARLVTWLWVNWKESPVRWLALLTQVLAGLRFSEVRALQKSDLDVPAGGVHIRRSRARKVTGTPKNKKARFQPLPSEVVEALRRFLLTTEGQLLFPADGGGHLSNNVLNRALRSACQLAGVREVTTHGLRRTAGSSYGFMGEGQKAIASMLGHADMKATERYVRVHERHKQALVTERWNRLMNAQ